MNKSLKTALAGLSALFSVTANAAIYSLSGEGYTISADIYSATTLSLENNQLIFNTNSFTALSPGNTIDTPPGRNPSSQEETYSFNLSIQDGYKLQSVTIGGTGSYVLKNYNSELVTASYSLGIASFVSGLPGQPNDFIYASSSRSAIVDYETGSIDFLGDTTEIFNRSTDYNIYTNLFFGLYAMHPTRPYYDEFGNLIPGSNGNSEVQVFLDNFYIEFNVVAVPEPSAYAMLGLGLGLVGLAASRRRKTLN